MADHKFSYTVSGVHLTEAQKHKISTSIGTAVAHVLGEESTHSVRSDFCYITRIYGGLWMDVAEVEKIGIANVLKSPAVVGVSGRE